DFKAQMTEFRQTLVDRLPSKKAELEAMAIANAEEKERLEAQARQRQQEERERMEREAEEKRRREEAAIAMKQTEGETMALFSQEAAIAEAAVEKPETRQGYEIEVSHQAGYVQIFQLWYEQEGKGLPMD